LYFKIPATEGFSFLYINVEHCIYYKHVDVTILLLLMMMLILFYVIIIHVLETQH